MSRLLVVSSLIVLSLLPGKAGARQSPGALPNPDDPGLSAAKLSRATELLNRLVAEQRIAGAVAGVARHGEIIYLTAAGFRDIESGERMTPTSIFRIYSMTKPVTAVAVMMLHEEGKFDLDDPVSRYLPEFRDLVVAAGGRTRPPRREMTVRDLLLHTSGLSHRTSAPYRAAGVRSRSVPLDQFITNIARVPLMEDPGTRFRYSESPTVLGRLVEVWSGQPFDAFLRQRVFEPLRMIDTGFHVRPSGRHRLTKVYGPSDAGGLVEIRMEDLPFTDPPALIEGAVGLVSTVPDFLRFSQMLLNRGELDGVRLLRPETVDLMTRNGLPEAVRELRGSTFGWGLANVNVLLETDGAGYPGNAGEYGWDGSAGTIFWIDPASETVIVLMTQISPTNPDRLYQRFKTIIGR